MNHFCFLVGIFFLTGRVLFSTSTTSCRDNRWSNFQILTIVFSTRCVPDSSRCRFKKKNPQSVKLPSRRTADTSFCAIERFSVLADLCWYHPLSSQLGRFAASSVSLWCGTCTWALDQYLIFLRTDTDRGISKTASRLKSKPSTNTSHTLCKSLPFCGPSSNNTHVPMASLKEEWQQMVIQHTFFTFYRTNHYSSEHTKTQSVSDGM